MALSIINFPIWSKLKEIIRVLSLKRLQIYGIKHRLEKSLKKAISRVQDVSGMAKYKKSNGFGSFLASLFTLDSTESWVTVTIIILLVFILICCCCINACLGTEDKLSLLSEQLWNFQNSLWIISHGLSFKKYTSVSSWTEKLQRNWSKSSRNWFSENYFRNGEARSGVFVIYLKDFQDK